jgi:DNA-binding LacI/PurR family transcriptional regulator
LKISIPGQVSVVGFGDDPEAKLFHPSLTTVRGEYREVAREAVEIIERRLSGDCEEVIQKMIPMTLIQAESTGKILIDDLRRRKWI